MYLRKHAAHKHLVLIVNKCDLVPTWVTKQWVTRLSQTVPTLAFHASMGSPFGKGALINLLRQFAKLVSSSRHTEGKSLHRRNSRMIRGPYSDWWKLTAWLRSWRDYLHTWLSPHVHISRKRTD